MSLPEKNPEAIAEILINNEKLSDEIISLDINKFSINIRSNSSELLDWCRHYFSYVVQANEIDTANIEIVVIERQPLVLDIEFQPWIRHDTNKTSKDAIYDLPGARIIKKVRTGMIFLQSRSHIVAAGECLKYKNQIINFINSQYMNYIQNHHGVICHAAGLLVKDHEKEQVLGMAGFSGGGKSTLMLHMLNQPNSRFLSNDRLFLIKSDHSTTAVGIPKLPRVNPGTILHNPKLQELISEERRHELFQLPQKELWNLEEKFDVIVDEVYGPDKIQYQGDIKHFIVLNWSHDSKDKIKLEKINLSQRKDLLAAIMKSSGPFYQYENGDFYQNLTPFDEQSYLDVFANINVYEVSGQIDFQALSQLCFQELLS